VNTVIAIAIGGAFGAVSRHLLAGRVTQLLGLGFPYGTLVVNLLGCFLLGLLVELFALKLSVPRPVQAMLTTGFMGAFTTFSTFSLETVLLVERQNIMLAALYVGVSVVLGIGAFALAMVLVRSLA
jgi:CrcB protein